jgi:hypothetical protein
MNPPTLSSKALLVFIAAPSAAALLAAAAAQSPFALREVNNGAGLELCENGKPVYVYNYGVILAPGYPETMRRSTYLHPIYLPDGTVFTDDFNRDRPPTAVSFGPGTSSKPVPRRAPIRLAP